MIMRITWGKLRAGCWQEYEQAYRATVADKAVPGLRGRWLAQDVQDPEGVLPSACGTPLRPCRPMSRVRFFGKRFNRPCNPFLSASTPPIGVR